MLQFSRIVTQHYYDDITSARDVIYEVLESVKSFETFLVTPGGLFGAELSGIRLSGVGWHSKVSDAETIFNYAREKLAKSIFVPKLRAALRTKVQGISIGVDLFEPSLKHTPRAELVAIYDAQSEKIVGMTGKSYPVAYQQDDLFVVKDFDSHFVKFRDNMILVLGCHDLNIFSPRSAANRAEFGPRSKIAKDLLALCDKNKPTIVIQHPHTTDTPNIWRVGWVGVQRLVPSVSTFCSGIRYFNRMENPGPKWKTFFVTQNPKTLRI